MPFIIEKENTSRIIHQIPILKGSTDLYLLIDYDIYTIDRGTCYAAWTQIQVLYLRPYGYGDTAYFKNSGYSMPTYNVSVN